VAFCVGPALYKYGDGLLPGPDLFSQYGAGQGFFFAFFLGDTAGQTVDNFYVLYLAVTLAFFVLAYHFLARLLGSRAWAFSVCLLALLGQFYDWMGLQFTVTPSIGVYRMPLLVVVGWLFAWFCRTGFRPGAALAVGWALGLSLFWSTDTGAASLCACLGSTLVLSRSVRRAAGMAVALTASAAATFLLLCVAAYGTGVLGLRYLTALVAPWASYAGGNLSSEVYPWYYSNGYLFTLAALVCSMGVIASLSARVRASRRPVPFRAGALVFLGFVSLLLHVKYVVKANFCYWAGTGLPALAVMAWAVKHFGPPLYRAAIASAWPRRLAHLRGRRVPRFLTALTGLLCAACLAAGVRGPENRYGVWAYLGYNSLLNTAIRPALARAGIPASPPDPVPPRYSEADGIWYYLARGDPKVYCTEADLDLIRGNTEPGERTAIVSWVDWAFLLGAKRPPRYFMLPAPATEEWGGPSLAEEFARATNGSRVLFVDRACEGSLTALVPGWRDRFCRAGESEHLVLYRQRRADATRRPR
jgi:hypothetical protein